MVPNISPYVTRCDLMLPNVTTRTYHRRARQYAAEYPALSRHRNLCRVALDLSLLPAEGQDGPDRGQDLLGDGA